MIDFEVNRTFVLRGRRQGVVLVGSRLFGLLRDEQEATIFTIGAPSGDVEVCRIVVAHQKPRILIRPKATNPASQVDCLLVEQEYPALARQLFLEGA